MFALLLILLLLGRDRIKEEPEPSPDPEIQDLSLALEKVPAEQRQQIADFVTEDNLQGRLEILREFEKLQITPAGQDLTRQVAEMDPQQRVRLSEWNETSDLDNDLR